ncbi:MAG: sigma-E factor negative regulatory protein, partial [Burkholderiaceae bacterium]|nr:sigma-E factor negative regulatory protein [Burkholderiaceae bacterium]
MNDDVNKREQISALVDGALQGDGWAQAVQSASDEEGQATWQMYHLIGDVLRSPDLAPPCDTALLQRLRGQIAQEPRPPSVVPAPPAVLWPVPGGAGDASRAPEAANAAVFRWKMAAGVASLAAVVAV